MKSNWYSRSHTAVSVKTRNARSSSMISENRESFFGLFFSFHLIENIYYTYESEHGRSTFTRYMIYVNTWSKQNGTK